MLVTEEPSEVGTVNGFGTSPCRGRGLVKWTDGEDSDAVICFVAVFLPLFPIRAIHTFQFAPYESQDAGVGVRVSGSVYSQVPIKMTLGLAARVFAVRWINCIVAIGVMSLVVGLCGALDYLNGKHRTDEQLSMIAWALGIGTTVTAIGGTLGGLLRWTDRRRRTIRRIIGRHIAGNSDPVDWTSEFVAQAPSSDGMFGYPTFAAAAVGSLTKGRFRDAMFAARLCAAVEDRTRGEELTDQILADPRVREALARVGPRGENWAEAMNPQAASAEG